MQAYLCRVKVKGTELNVVSADIKGWTEAAQSKEWVLAAWSEGVRRG